MCKIDPAICLVEEAICAMFRPTGGQTDDGRRAIALAHLNHLKMDAENELRAMNKSGIK